MKISLKKTIAAALALLTLTAASVSAKSSTARHITSPAAAKKQLNTIAKAEPLWKDEFVARRDAGQTPQPHLLNFDPAQTRFAVTDLDGNGRMELLFRHAAMLPVAEGITPEPLRNIPTAIAWRSTRSAQTDDSRASPRRKTATAHPISWICMRSIR